MLLIRKNLCVCYIQKVHLLVYFIHHQSWFSVSKTAVSYAQQFLKINFLTGENEINFTDPIYKTISHHACNLRTLPVQYIIWSFHRHWIQ